MSQQSYTKKVIYDFKIIFAFSSINQELKDELELFITDSLKNQAESIENEIDSVKYKSDDLGGSDAVSLYDALNIIRKYKISSNPCHAHFLSLSIYQVLFGKE